MKISRLNKRRTQAFTYEMNRDLTRRAARLGIPVSKLVRIYCQMGLNGNSSVSSVPAEIREIIGAAVIR